MARPVVALQPPKERERTHPTVVTQLLAASCRLRTATAGAALSLLVVLLMVGAAVVCADGACRALPEPGTGRAVLDMSSAPHPATPGSAAPIAPGPRPP